MLLYLRSKSLSKQILAVVLAVSSLVTAALTIFQLTLEYTEGVQEVEKRFEIIQQMQLDGIATGLWELNDEQTDQHLLAILSLPEMRFVEIRNQGKVLYKKGTPLESQSKITKQFNLTKLIDEKTENLGEVYIEADLSSVADNVLHKAFIIFMSQFFKTLIVSILLYFVFQRMQVVQIA